MFLSMVKRSKFDFMFSKNDLKEVARKSLQAIGVDTPIGLDKIIENHIDNNRRYILKEDSAIFELMPDMSPGQAIWATKGTEFRQMSCEDPKSSSVICDIISVDSPSKKCYHVPLINLEIKHVGEAS